MRNYCVGADNIRTYSVNNKQMKGKSYGNRNRQKKTITYDAAVFRGEG